MDKQQNLSFFNDELKEVKTRKREFLEQMKRIIPWGELEELARPCYYEGKRGNKPFDLKLMLLTLKILIRPESTEGVDSTQTTALKEQDKDMKMH